MKRCATIVGVLAACLIGSAAHAQDPKDNDHEERLERLEQELEELRKERGGDLGAEDDLDALLEDAEAEAGEDTGPSEDSYVQRMLNVFNPQITVFGDFLGRAAVGPDPLTEEPTDPDSAQLDNRFNLREVELDFRASVDPFADAVVIVAYETEEPGDLAGEVLVEEGYVILNFLPFGISPRIGRYHVGFGRANVLHLHDQPQPSFPLPIQQFLGEESLVEQGVSVQWLIPNPFDLALTWNVEVINGEGGEESPILAGEDSKNPAYVSRLSYFQEVGDSLTIDLGWSTLFGYNDADGDRQSLLWGADVTVRWRPRKESQFWSVVFQSELFLLDKEVDATTRTRAWGWYAYLHVQAWQSWYLGARFGYSELPDDDESNIRRTGVYLSYYFSEFLRFRVGYEHTEYDFSRASGERAPTHDGFVFQLTFIFGSHPVEPFWVNR